MCPISRSLSSVTHTVFIQRIIGLQRAKMSPKFFISKLTGGNGASGSTGICTSRLDVIVLSGDAAGIDSSNAAASAEGATPPGEEYHVYAAEMVHVAEDATPACSNESKQSRGQKLKCVTSMSYMFVPEGGLRQSDAHPMSEVPSGLHASSIWAIASRHS